jgi:hypothetical protein
MRCRVGVDVHGVQHERDRERDCHDGAKPSFSKQVAFMQNMAW